MNRHCNLCLAQTKLACGRFHGGRVPDADSTVLYCTVLYCTVLYCTVLNIVSPVTFLWWTNIIGLTPEFCHATIQACYDVKCKKVLFKFRRKLLMMISTKRQTLTLKMMQRALKSPSLWMKMLSLILKLRFVTLSQDGHTFVNNTNSNTIIPTPEQPL